MYYFNMKNTRNYLGVCRSGNYPTLGNQPIFRPPKRWHCVSQGFSKDPFKNDFTAKLVIVGPPPLATVCHSPNWPLSPHVTGADKLFFTKNMIKECTTPRYKIIIITTVMLVNLHRSPLVSALEHPQVQGCRRVGGEDMSYHYFCSFFDFWFWCKMNYD